MPALKYWNGSAWVPIIGGPVAATTWRNRYSWAKDDTRIDVNATSYGAFIGPSCNAFVGPTGEALIHFYAQTGLTASGGSDLVVTYSVVRSSDGAPIIYADDANCLYLLPSGTGGQGPGFISGIMLATGITPNDTYTFLIHHRVSMGVTNLLRRRMAVVPRDVLAF